MLFLLTFDTVAPPLPNLPKAVKSSTLQKEDPILKPPEEKRSRKDSLTDVKIELVQL